jgi:hypothetical protein
VSYAYRIKINAGLSAEAPFVDVLSSAELLLYPDFAVSALKKAAPLSRERSRSQLSVALTALARPCLPRAAVNHGSRCVLDPRLASLFDDFGTVLK